MSNGHFSQIHTGLLSVTFTDVLSVAIVGKGAMVSRHLIESDGNIEANEWGDGPPMDRADVLRSVLEGADDSGRCQQAITYYCKSMEILGICARGKMPTTELLCAAKLPFGELIARMGEIQQLADAARSKKLVLPPTVVKNSRAIEVLVKSSLLEFFREVFVDTNSTQILRTLRQAGNGLWSAPEGVDVPIVQYLLKDLELLLATPDTAQCQYIFNQVVPFFHQYACAVPLGSASSFEQSIIVTTMDKISEVAKNAGKNWTQEMESPHGKQWTWRLSQLSNAVAAYVAGTKVMPYSEAADHLGTPGTEPEPSSVTWRNFVDASIDSDDVRFVRGTDRLVGRGMMDIAISLWQRSDDVAGSR
eukprot:SAG11_NODE_32_length_22830_cov_17.507941_17_plen_361_part_00